MASRFIPLAPREPLYLSGVQHYDILPNMTGLERLVKIAHQIVFVRPHVCWLRREEAMPASNIFHSRSCDVTLLCACSEVKTSFRRVH